MNGFRCFSQRFEFLKQLLNTLKVIQSIKAAEKIAGLNIFIKNLNALDHSYGPLRRNGRKPSDFKSKCLTQQFYWLLLYFE